MKNLAESLEFEQSKNFKREDYYFDFPQKYTPRSVVLNSSNLSSMIEQSEKLSQPNSHRAPNQVKLKFNIQTRKFTEIPIEDKLFQKQMAAKTRLENLRQLREQEQLKCLQNKPKISKRSQELAKQAEDRLYQQICMQVEGEKPSQLPKFETETFIHKQDFLKNFEETPEIIKSGTPMKSTNRPEKETHFSIQTPFFKETQENQKPATPKRVASLKIKINPESCRNRSQSISSPKKIQLNLTVIERNEAWLKSKKEKLSIQINEKENSNLNECTFSPVIYSRVPHNLQQTRHQDLHRISKSREASTYHSQNSSATITRVNSISSLMMEVPINQRRLSVCSRRAESVKGSGGYVSLTPFHRDVSFKSGCDIANFYTRAR